MDWASIILTSVLIFHLVPRGSVGAGGGEVGLHFAKRGAETMRREEKASDSFEEKNEHKPS